jgi:hypothetical protein
MAVCIAGMHRSGTSMVSRALHLVGLDLGRSDHLGHSAPDNEAGFWEHPGFVRLNEALLALMGGRWDSPPAGADWTDPRLEDHRREALRLVEEFKGSRSWGWKDPRNSLTLPFWRQVIDDLVVVIVVRNPLEVAASLRRRNGFPAARGLRLWVGYNESALSASDEGHRTVTMYGDWFADPEGEVRRMAPRLGLHPGHRGVSAACDSVDPMLRHHRSDASPISSGVDAAVDGLYRRLAAEASASKAEGGPVPPDWTNAPVSTRLDEPVGGGR